MWGEWSLLARRFVKKQRRKDLGVCLEGRIALWMNKGIEVCRLWFHMSEITRITIMFCVI